MPHIEIRPARAEDRDAVLAFSAHTWEWGDYIVYVWDKWLNDPDGALLVATADGTPVGLAHMQMLSAKDAWLEGLRVDPDYRRQGLGIALNQAMLVEAMKRGATHARLLTGADNIASITMVEHHHWRRVSEIVPYTALPMAALSRHELGPDLPQLATLDDIDDIIDYLNTSNIYPTSGGLYYQGFTAYVMTTEDIEARVKAGHVYILRRWDRLDGFAFAEPREGRQQPELFIGYVDGTTESISLLAYVLRKQAAEMELNRIRAHIPDLMMVRDAFTAAGYEWDGATFYTYERGLY